MQCHVMGISTIFVGFRNKNYIVSRINEYSIKEIKEDIIKNNRGFNLTLCYSLAGNFLKMLEKEMQNYG